MGAYFLLSTTLLPHCMNSLPSSFSLALNTKIDGVFMAFCYFVFLLALRVLGAFAMGFCIFRYYYFHEHSLGALYIVVFLPFFSLLILWVVATYLFLSCR